MKTINSVDFFADVGQYKNNPIMAHYRSLDLLSELFEGANVDMDPASPFVWALDCTALNTAAFLDEHAASVRQLNANAAKNQEDLYKHMSDKDYYGRFALPATAEFMIAIEVNDLETSMVPGHWGSRQLVIPPNTFFQVGGYQFSMEYPVHITKTDTSNFSINHGLTNNSPFGDHPARSIDYEIIVSSNNIKYLRFNVPTKQFSIETRMDTVSYSTGRYFAFEFPDEFCLARVYVANPYSNALIWEEIKTTHNDQVFNPDDRTVLVKVVNNTVRFEIPYVYIHHTDDSKAIRGKIRYDVYTTKGKISVDLSKFNPEHFVATWYAVDDSDWFEDSIAVKSLKNIFMRSNTLVSGGRSSLSFDDLKTRVMSNALGRQNLPITNAQMNSHLIDLGFEIKADIDTVTNRVFQACKDSPEPIDSSVITSASVSMQTLSTSIEYASFCKGVFSNTYGVTITSGALYKNENGVVSLVSVNECNSIMAMDNIHKARIVNERNYFYSPFYYVLDNTAFTFEVRAYNLDTPKIITKSFALENTSSIYKVNFTSTHGVFKVDEGYLIELRTKSNAQFKKLIIDHPDDVTIYIAYGENDDVQFYKFIEGTVVHVDDSTQERTYHFLLKTKFAIDADHQIEWTNFSRDGENVIKKTELKILLNVFAIVRPRIKIGGIEENINSPGYTPTELDSIIDLSKYKESAVECIVKETLIIDLGVNLKNLWCQSRSNVASIEYETYATDVPLVAQEDLYELDPETGRYLRFDDNGKIIKTIKHKKGDVVLDEERNPIILHKKGDVVYDGENPVPRKDYKNHMTRFVDILTIEGAYYFATDTVSTAYKNYIKAMLVKWITKDLPQFESLLLEQTKIFYHPKSSSGVIPILSSNNTMEYINAAQSLKLILHVPSSTFNNSDLRNSLIRISIKIIDEKFKKTIVSVSEIEKALKERFLDDVINVELLGVTGSSKYPIVTVLDSGTRLSIRKKLVSYPGSILGVDEDVTVVFSEHGFSV